MYCGKMTELEQIKEYARYLLDLLAKHDIEAKNYTEYLEGKEKNG